MNDYMTLLHKHKINGGFLAPDRIPMEERNKNEMILELQNEVHTKDKEIKRLNNIINELEKWLEEQHQFIIEIPAYTKEISIEHKTMEICYENVLDKLQELKGSDKE